MNFLALTLASLKTTFIHRCFGVIIVVIGWLTLLFIDWRLSIALFAFIVGYGTLAKASGK